jgi:DNA-3-methyladenine glycosylase II
MLGIEIDLTRFYRLAALDPKLEKLAGQFVGMKPPRFPTLFESLVNAIACQQVTLTLGIRLLNKLAVRYGLMAQRQDKPDHAFPTPEALAVADPDELRSMGLSRHKARALIELASALAENCLSLDQPTTMDDEAAVAFLSKIRGVGRWTAEYALLRGMGRIHIFPGDDVGARKNLERWLGMAEALDYEGVRRSIAPWKSYGGLIYFHLLLNRLQEAGYLQILKNRRNVMPTRSAEAVWSGTIREGSGRVKLGSGAYEGAYSFASRFEDAKGTNPEELIGAAHAGCFSMYLALVISKAGYTPARIRTTAKVHLGEGPRISRIDLDTEAEVAGLDEQTFSQYAADAKKNCPVSMALAGTEITLNARLVS